MEKKGIFQFAYQNKREEKRREEKGSGIVDEEGVMKRGMEEQQGEDLFGSLDI